ncbi:hypothetical protein ACH4PU_32810 [Streptomyces sp. NPDC021100]|uniref:hypothetical protein n=1 Tax=Streptomyces sp. NPDC021100 TaxID=3365114 RepID=UPI003791BAC9
MSLEHSVYVVYGVELAGADWLHVDGALEELRRARARRTGDAGVGLFLVQGEDACVRVVIGTASEDVPPGACRPVRNFAPSPEWDEVLRAAVAALGCRVLAGPGWLIAHDWS